MITFQVQEGASQKDQIRSCKLCVSWCVRFPTIGAGNYVHIVIGEFLTPI